MPKGQRWWFIDVSCLWSGPPNPLNPFWDSKIVNTLLINYSLPSLRLEKSYNVWNIQVFGDAPVGEIW